MDNNEASRKKFEESYISILEPSNERVKTEIISKFSDGEYKNIMTNVSWKLWQAAQQQSDGKIAELETDLEKARRYADMCNMECISKDDWLSKANADNERLREALLLTIETGKDLAKRKELSNPQKSVMLGFIDAIEERINNLLTATQVQSLQSRDEVKE